MKKPFVLSYYHTGTMLALEQLRALSGNDFSIGAHSYCGIGHAHIDSVAQLPRSIMADLSQARVVIPIRNPLKAHLSLIWRLYGTKENYLNQMNFLERKAWVLGTLQGFRQLFKVKPAFLFTWELAMKRGEYPRLVSELADYVGYSYSDEHLICHPVNSTEAILNRGNLHTDHPHTIATRNTIERENDPVFFNRIKEQLEKGKNSEFKMNFYYEHVQFRKHGQDVKEQLQKMGYGYLGW